MTKKKVTDRMLWLYPHPSILGLTLSKDYCGRVQSVEADSIAAKAGVLVGDDIVSLMDQPIGSVADVQWVLHNFADEGGTLSAKLARGGKSVAADMQLGALWRRAGDWAWRYRVAGYAMWLWGGVTLEDTPRGVRVANPSPWWFKRQNNAARDALKVGDIIQRVDGKTDWTRSTYLAYLMREKKPGAKIELEVLRKGKTQKVSFRVPKPRPEIMGH